MGRPRISQGISTSFQIVTYRAIAAATTAFPAIAYFRELGDSPTISLKPRAADRTKEEVHKLYELHGQKAGTPPMGGVLIIGSVLISSLLWARLIIVPCGCCSLPSSIVGALGFWDDYLKITKKNSAGISERTKLIGQAILAAIVATYFLTNPAIEVQARALFVPFFKQPIIWNLGGFTAVFFAVVILGASNAVNLTDGLDGLAAGCTITTAIAYGVLTYVAGHIVNARYLDIPFYPFASELAVVCMALAGAAFGFLWWNCHPAKVFMGDTGSLAIGGFFGVVAICCKQELLLVVVGGVFVLEAVSVLIQRTWFKVTKRIYGEGRRVFLMSPIHHHFELKGWKENTVIVRFWILSVMFALLGLATLKLR
jgi:phospho-N-acetylmuramoyl-pentapeptide-transferase